jgi:hypothetical protein
MSGRGSRAPCIRDRRHAYRRARWVAAEEGRGKRRKNEEQVQRTVTNSPAHGGKRKGEIS